MSEFSVGLMWLCLELLPERERERERETQTRNDRSLTLEGPVVDSPCLAGVRNCAYPSTRTMITVITSACHWNTLAMNFKLLTY